MLVGSLNGQIPLFFNRNAHAVRLATAARLAKAVFSARQVNPAIESPWQVTTRSGVTATPLFDMLEPRGFAVVSQAAYRAIAPQIEKVTSSNPGAGISQSTFQIGAYNTVQNQVETATTSAHMIARYANFATLATGTRWCGWVARRPGSTRDLIVTATGGIAACVSFSLTGNGAAFVATDSAAGTTARITPVECNGISGYLCEVVFAIAASGVTLDVHTVQTASAAITVANFAASHLTYLGSTSQGLLTARTSWSLADGDRIDLRATRFADQSGNGFNATAPYSSAPSIMTGGVIETTDGGNTAIPRGYTNLAPFNNIVVNGSWWSMPSNLLTGMAAASIITMYRRPTVDASQVFQRVFDFNANTQNYWFGTATQSGMGSRITQASNPGEQGAPFAGPWTNPSSPHILCFAHSGRSITTLSDNVIQSQVAVTLKPSDVVATNAYIGRSAYSDPINNAFIGEFWLFGSDESRTLLGQGLQRDMARFFNIPMTA